jgi:transposase
VLTPLRAPRGERTAGRAPRDRGANTTPFAALTAAGLGPAMVIEGAADRPALEVYLRALLVPSRRPGQGVVRDNLNVHKGEAIRGPIESAGSRLLFPPAYSPAFSPNEPAFAKVKALPRRAEARTREALEAAIGRAVDAITPADARGLFAHCGYPLPHQLL